MVASGIPLPLHLDKNEMYNKNNLSEVKRKDSIAIK